jgi:fibrillarin-like pre-rRNA processing protein
MEMEDVYSEFNPLGAFEGVYRVKNISGIELATKNLVKGVSVYDERLFNTKHGELREFSHKRSKLASSILQGFRFDQFHPSMKVLYLGASFGTTTSHFSDLLHKNGLIYAVEFAPRPVRDLLLITNQRENIIPILSDARYPEEYTHLVDSVDLVYCDVAQANQSEIFISNLRAFAKPKSFGFITIKSKSISQVKHPKQVFTEQEDYLEGHGFKIIKSYDINRYHRDHMSYFGQFKG